MSVSTASIALRGLAKVDPGTRARVQAVAKKYGYVRDPQLAGALAFARRRDKPVYRETIGFLADAQPGDYGQMGWLREEYEGAAEMAARMGYGMECFYYPLTSREQRALGRKMHARGIRGLIMTPGLQRAPFSLDMDWSLFTAVEIGQTLLSPALPRIVHDSADDYAMMFAELRKRGYRRIGLTITRHEERRRHWAIMSAYLTFQYISEGLPKLKALEGEGASWTDDMLEEWLGRNHPDVIVTNGPGVGLWLKRTGRNVPGDVGLCRIDASGGQDSGLRPNYAALGRTAVNMLASALEHGVNGEIMPRALLCIPNGWHEGESLRAAPG